MHNNYLKRDFAPKTNMSFLDNVEGKAKGMLVQEKLEDQLENNAPQLRELAEKQGLSKEQVANIEKQGKEYYDKYADNKLTL